MLLEKTDCIDSLCLVMDKKEFMTRLDKRLVGYKDLPNIHSIQCSIRLEVLEELNKILREEGLEEVPDLY